ncbi:hypothetical protein NHX12_012200 [Muraenolepis orangiensis]|uniref:Uncharacterized protein n=1 Tax=Muraenolepis orangiensis TaxID=630683 RepID=A0A9Q0I6W3_9TELE|nr:hypothetical protein NHX12_012200 [Muraenolepis orangiensis]
MFREPAGEVQRWLSGAGGVAVPGLGKLSEGSDVQLQRAELGHQVDQLIQGLQPSLVRKGRWSEDEDQVMRRVVGGVT